MDILANILGILAVALFVISYQIKKRNMLIAVNAASRILYVTQYILLGAFEGALLDIIAFFISLLCHKRDSKFIKRYFVIVFILSNAVIVGAGLLTYRNLFSLLPIFGVIFEILALWFRKERNIRIFSLAGAPFWLAYNLYSNAFGSAIGNVITLVSISAAILRYDILKKKADTADKEAKN